MHSLFSVQVDVYSTQRRLFACLGELPDDGLPPGGVDPQRGIRETAVRSYRAVSRSYEPPWGDLPA